MNVVFHSMEGLDIRLYCIQQLIQTSNELKDRLKLEERQTKDALNKRIAVINEILKFDNPIVPQDLVIAK